MNYDSFLHITNIRKPHKFSEMGEKQQTENNQIEKDKN